MRRFAIVLLALVLVSCGRADKPLLGAWERSVPAPGGDSDTQVLEFFDGGMALLSATNGELGAAFKATGSTIALKGTLARAWPGKIRYRVTGNSLAIDRTPAGGTPDHSEWARLDKAPLFALKPDHGSLVPVAMPQFLSSITDEVRRYWHDDAVATGFAATRNPAGDYALMVSFYSPGDSAALRATVTRWLIRTTPMRASDSTALPADFKDISALLSKERDRGHKGILVNAALVNTAKRAVWAISVVSGKNGATDFYAANDGSRVKLAQLGIGASNNPSTNNSSSVPNLALMALVPGVAAVMNGAPQSNASGNTVSFSSNRPIESFSEPSFDSESSSDSASSDNNSASNNGYSGEPLPSGETCYYSSYAACNAAANGDTWAADRIENGTATGSEQDWYGGAGTANDENTQQPENDEQPNQEEQPSQEEQQPSYEQPEQSEPSYQSEPEPSYQPEPEPEPSYSPPPEPEPSYEPPPSENSD